MFSLGSSSSPLLDEEVAVAVVDELLDDDVVAGVDELDGRRTDKNVSSQSESSEGANILEETFFSSK